MNQNTDNLRTHDEFHQKNYNINRSNTVNHYGDDIEGGKRDLRGQVNDDNGVQCFGNSCPGLMNLRSTQLDLQNLAPIEREILGNL